MTDNQYHNLRSHQDKSILKEKMEKATQSMKKGSPQVQMRYQQKY